MKTIIKYIYKHIKIAFGVERNYIQNNKRFNDEKKY